MTTTPREPNPFITIGVWLALWWGAVTLTAMALGPVQAGDSRHTDRKQAPVRRSRAALRVIEGGRR